MPIKRKLWNNYFMEIAEKVSERATCDRLRVGAILIKNKRLIATGFNGSLPGQEHCDDVGHLMMGDHCVRTIHAEKNCLLQAAKLGISVDGSICYCNWHPCLDCLMALIMSGIKKIYYRDIYRPDRVEKYPKEIMEIIPIEQVK